MKLYQNKYPISDEAKYVVDYIYDAPQGNPNFFFQLVRLADGAILYANEDINNVKVECWKLGIKYNEVSFI